MRQFHDEDGLDVVWANVPDVGGAVRVTLGVSEPSRSSATRWVTTSVVRFEWQKVMILPGLYVLFAGPSITTGVVAHLIDPAGRRTANPIMSFLPRRRDDRQPTRACPPPGTPALTSAPQTPSHP